MLFPPSILTQHIPTPRNNRREIAVRFAPISAARLTKYFPAFRQKPLPVPRPAWSEWPPVRNRGRGNSRNGAYFSGKSFVRKAWPKWAPHLGRESPYGVRRHPVHGARHRNSSSKLGQPQPASNLSLRTVQRSTAPAAAVGAVFVVEVIFTGKGASVPFRTITRSSSGVNGFIFCAFKVIAMPVSGRNRQTAYHIFLSCKKYTEIVRKRIHPYVR